MPSVGKAGKRRASGNAPKNDEAPHAPNPEEIEKRRRYIYITAVLVVIALGVLLFSNRATGLAGCEGIVLATQRYGCIGSLAAGTLNVSLCGYLPNSGECLLGIASQQKNINTCKLISNTSQYYYSCVMNVSAEANNASDCALLAGQEGDNCTYNVAKKDGFSGIAPCMQISNATMMGYCVNSYYYERAITHGDASYCAMLPNATNNTALAGLIEDTNQSPSYILEYDSIDASPRDYCYNQLAVAEGNESVCNLSSNAAQTLCKELLAYAQPHTNQTSAPAVCSALPPEPGTNSSNLTIYNDMQGIRNMTCAEVEAIGSKNVSICGRLSNGTIYNSCVWAFITKLNATEDCSYLTNTTLKDYCSTGNA